MKKQIETIRKALDECRSVVSGYKRGSESNLPTIDAARAALDEVEGAIGVSSECRQIIRASAFEESIGVVNGLRRSPVGDDYAYRELDDVVEVLRARAKEIRDEQ